MKILGQLHLDHKTLEKTFPKALRKRFHDEELETSTQDRVNVLPVFKSLSIDQDLEVCSESVILAAVWGFLR